MKFNEDLSVLHGYLCGDGCVIKNTENVKNLYYKIDFRNTNIILLKDFQTRFKRYFGLEPHIYNNERCQIGSKNIYYRLTENYSYYSYEWKIPKLNKKNLRFWLRAFLIVNLG